MALLNTSLLIFAVLFKNTFIVHHGVNNVAQSFVCFNETNDTFPDNWISLKPSIQDGLAIFQVSNISNTNNLILKYKIRLVFPNKSFGESQWKTVLNETFINNSKREFNNSLFTQNTNTSPPNSTEVYLKIDIVCFFCLLFFICLVPTITYFAKSVFNRKLLSAQRIPQVRQHISI